MGIYFKVFFSKFGDLIYISHLDFQRFLGRLFRRCLVPVKYSQGFNPRPRLSFPYALPLFLEIRREYFIMECESDIDIKNTLDDLNNKTIYGLRFLDIERVRSKKHDLSYYHKYKIRFLPFDWGNIDIIKEKIGEFKGIIEFNILNYELNLTSDGPINPLKLINYVNNDLNINLNIESAIKL